ncbi:hypothetical protein MMC24_001751 [Lignoscripta atroalba]|nr:hypothetical protein [Lignoscripta atroalba]
MPWRPLSRIAFAVATYPFQPASPADLPLELGDELYIIEEGGIEGSWYRGYLVAPPSLLAGLTSVKGQTLEARVFSGIFPKCCVEVREMLGDNAVNGQGPEADHGHGHPNEGFANGHFGDAGSSPTHISDHRPSSKIGSVEQRPYTAESYKGRKSEASQDISRSSSQKKPRRSSGQESARAVSCRSKTARKSQGSIIHLTPVATTARDPGVPRPPAPVPMLKIGDETPTSSSEPLVDEIASCLREWHSTNLHELLLSRRYSVLERVSRLVQQLDLSRRQLLHGVLTTQELSHLREKTVWDLVSGNKMLSSEVIVRDPLQHGRLLTGDDSAIAISKLQATMSLLEKPPVALQESVKLHHLMVEIKGFSNNGRESPTLLAYLCLKTPGEPSRPLTETFVIDTQSDDQLSKATAAGKLKTLYTDLTPNDVGDVPGLNSAIYLIIKVQVNELPQPASLTPSKKTTSREFGSRSVQTGESESSSPVSVKGGRRSFMWAQKQMGGSHRGRAQGSKLAQSPTNADSTFMDEAPPRTPVTAHTTTQQGPQLVKRNLGVGVLDLRDFFGQSRDMEQTMTVWSPVGTSMETREPEQGWDELVRELMTSHTGRFSRCKVVDNVRLHLYSFVSDEAEALIRKTPTLLHNISRTPKIGFSGAPTKPRSDIYLTLSEASLPAQALLSHPERGTVQLSPSSSMRNVQLTLEVRKATGDRIDHCIFPSSTGPGLTAWRTPAVDRGETWNQTIKLVVPSEDVPTAHLIMSVADAPGFPFALCWMPLWDQQAFIKDGSHLPLLYLYDKVTASTDSGRGAYLNFPWNSKAKDNSLKDVSLTGPVATLALETYLCSTVFSQNEVLLGVLKWREQSDSRLSEMLKQWVFVPEIEIVKQVNDVFDALFGILVDRSGKDEFENLVFNTLVTVLGIVHDRRFNLGPLVDEYASNRFNYPFATPGLIKSYRRLLLNPADPQNSRQLRATFKVGRQILRFIMNARKQQEAKEAGIGITTTKSAFSRDISAIFTAIEGLMRHQSAVMIGTKTLVVQHMHAWLPELEGCFDEADILQIAIRFLDACVDVKGKLILYKLVLIQNLSRSITLLRSDLRQRLASHTSGWIAPYWGVTDDITEQWREQVRLCCSIVSSQANELESQCSSYFVKAVQSYRSIQLARRPPKETLSMLFPTVYPFPTKSTAITASFEESLIELGALLAILSDKHLASHINSLGTGLISFLTAALEVGLSILSGDAFPNSWLSLHIYHHRSILRMLEILYEVMAERCLPTPDDADDFNTDIWKLFLTTLLKLVRSGALALETFPEQKRRAVWKIAGDVREHGAGLLRRSWEAIGWETTLDEQRQYGLQRLGGYQVQYVPSLVAAIVELCLSVHEGLRGVAVGILQSMIVSEWTLNEDLSVIQAEMIDCLDRIYKSNNVGETVQQKIFVGELLDLFEPLARIPNDPLWSALKDLVFIIDELLDLLVAVHSTDVTEAFRIMHTLRLMDFLKDMEKEDMFIRYVHQLAEVQAQCRDTTEAGLALRLHADLYAWDSARVLPPLIDPAFIEQTSFERKEQLYFEMINFFEDGAAWECAIASYRELADQYEQSIFDYAKLARTQRSMARIYDIIARGERQSPRYFLVSYRGFGFPTSLRDKQFIFQGNVAERLSAFTDRLQQQHPAAQIVSLGDIDDLEGQFLQVSAVSPHRDLEHPLYQRSKVPQSTRDYVLSSQPNQFAVTSRRHSPKSSVKDQWIEKTVYTTADSFPTILRRSEIISVDVVALSPLQTSVERTRRKTAELAALAKRITDGDDSSLTSLTDAVKASVDASSPTTVVQYRELLSTPRDDLLVEPETAVLESALKAALIDHASTLKHCLTLYSRPANQATQADLSYRLASTFAPELAVLVPNPPPKAPSPQITTWLPHPQTPPALTLDRASFNIEKSPSNTITNGDHGRFLPTVPSSTSSRPDTQPNHSRNRLSLSFLRRPNATEEPLKTKGVLSSGSISSQLNGTDHSLHNGDFSSSRATSRSRNENRHSAVIQGSDDGRTSRASRSRGGSVGKKSKGEDRPVTAESEASRGARVKKRLSMLGVGKKGSKASFGGGSGSVAGDRVGSVREE